MSVVGCGARVMAATFAAGVALAVPQAAGVAAADDGSVGGVAASADRGQTPGRVPARSDAAGNRSAPKARAGLTRPSRDVPARSAALPAATSVAGSSGAASPGAGVPRQGGGQRAGAAPARRAPAVRLPVASAPASTVNTATPSARPVAEVAALSTTGIETPNAVADSPSAAPVLGVVASAVADWLDASRTWLSGMPGGPLNEWISGSLLLARRTLFGDALSAHESYQAMAAAAQADGIETAPPSEATIAVTNWFSGTWGWLSGLDNPLATAVATALVGVQQALFSPTPTVKPVQLTAWTAGDPVEGALRYIQPGGAPVSFALSQGPALGTVEVRNDGSYTYTPGPDFAGTDTFTVDVTAGGFNILEPFSPRTTSVRVNVTPSPVLMSTQGFNIHNLSGQAAYLTEIQKEPGYAGDVFSGPVGTILQIGDSYHVELTFWAFYGFTTNFLFKPCVDITCKGGTRGAVKDTPWLVGLRLNAPSFTDPRWASTCWAGDCKNGSGQIIGPSDSWHYGGDGKYNVFMLDPAGTSRTLTGEQAQQQAQAINAVCSTSGSFCQFTPTADAEDVTKTLTVYVFRNETQDNETVTNTSSVLVSATSSFGTTYSSEVSASYGQKDAFTVAAKQTFSSTTTLTNAFQKTTTWSVNNTVRPDYQLITTVEVPAVRANGDFTAIIGNTTYNMTGVYFDFIDPNAPAQLIYRSRTEPLA